MIGHRGAGRARGLLAPLKDPGGPAGPLYQWRILLIGQHVTGGLVAGRGGGSGNSSGGRYIVAGSLRLTSHRIQVMTGQV